METNERVMKLQKNTTDGFQIYTCNRLISHSLISSVAGFHSGFVDFKVTNEANVGTTDSYKDRTENAWQDGWWMQRLAS